MAIIISKSTQSKTPYLFVKKYDEQSEKLMLIVSNTNNYSESIGFKGDVTSSIYSINFLEDNNKLQEKTFINLIIISSKLVGILESVIPYLIAFGILGFIAYILGGEFLTSIACLLTGVSMMFFGQRIVETAQLTILFLIPKKLGWKIVDLKDYSRYKKEVHLLLAETPWGKEQLSTV